jgi:Cell wall-active antibiotics response 4TMS YvqF
VLRIKTGVGKSEIDLSKLRVTDFTLEGGVGAMSVVMPASGRITARIESGVGATRIRIPNGMNARIRASSGLGQVRVLGSYQRDGDVYTSDGFETASTRLELEIKGGIGQITIESGG